MKNDKVYVDKGCTQTEQEMPAWQILAIDATSDDVTRTVHDYRQSIVYPKLKQQVSNLVLLAGADDTRANVAKEALSPMVRYIMGEGHGTRDTLEGYTGQVVFAIGEYNAKEVSGKVTHLLSCEAAASLGPDMVSRGCRAFFGYDIDYSFPTEFSDIFLECDSEIDLAFAGGLSAKDVYSQTQALHEQKIAELKHKGGDAANRAAAHLETLLLHLRCPSRGSAWGKEEARVW